MSPSIIDMTTALSFLFGCPRSRATILFCLLQQSAHWRSRKWKMMVQLVQRDWRVRFSQMDWKWSRSECSACTECALLLCIHWSRPLVRSSPEANQSVLTPNPSHLFVLLHILFLTPELLSILSAGVLPFRCVPFHTAADCRRVTLQVWQKQSDRTTSGLVAPFHSEFELPLCWGTTQRHLFPEQSAVFSLLSALTCGRHVQDPVW